MAAELANAIKALQQEVMSLKAAGQTAEATEDEEMDDPAEETEGAIPDWD